MSSQVPSFHVNIEERIISANLNSSMLLNFLMGVYTIVYGGTVYLYLPKKTANKSRRAILSTISALYLLCFANFIVQWYFISQEIVVNGDTRETIFWGTVDNPQWFSVVDNFVVNSLFLVSDGLLIWRCYHVWGQSMMIISVPLVLLVVELGLSITMIVLNALLVFLASKTNAALCNSISSSLSFVSLGTTVITTFLIGYKIHTATQSIVSKSKRLYNRILVTIIESAAAYSIVLLLEAITGVVPSLNDVQSTMLDAQYYIEAILPILAGMAPTILVARFALRDPTSTVASTSISHISGLNFASEPASGNGSIPIGNSTGGGIITSVVQRDHAPDSMAVTEFKRPSDADGV